MTLPPPLPLASWEDTKRTLHLYLQIVGKVRLALHPQLNHWWHVTLYLSPRGLTTGAIPMEGGLLELELDFIDHLFTIRISTAPSWRLPLRDGLSVAEFYGRVLGQLAALGVQPPLLARPYDPARVGSDLPFAEDTRHARYDAGAVTHFWQLLAWTHGVFSSFRGGFYGKSSPVHLFWHSLDLAHTRFSGRAAPREGGTPANREAYSHELVSFGFWAGDEGVTEPSFYSYTYPEPPGLREAPLKPTGARWSQGTALLPLEQLRLHADPSGALLDFLESTYRAGATRADWDLEGLRAGPRR